MAAYSAVACFRQTLKQLLDSDEFPLDFPEPQTLSLHENAYSLQTSLDNIPFVPKKWRKEMNELQTRIRDAIYAAHDKVDYSISKGHSSEKSDEIPLKKIVDDIDLVAKEVEEMVEAIRNDPQAQNSLSENPQPSKFSFRGKDKIVGQEKDFQRVADELLSEERQRLVIPITGLPGLGKTTLARSIYEDRGVTTQFNIRAWVTVSQEYNFHEIYSKLLSSMESKNYQAGHYAKQGDEQTLFNHLQQELYNLKYLIVVDDVWESKVWDRVIQALPDKENGSRILLTTRIPEVATYIQPYGFIHEMRSLGPEDSWKLLRYKVFGDNDFLRVTDQLLSQDKQLQVIPITGLPGLGKTTLARTIYENGGVTTQFNIRAWVTVSQEYNFQEIYSKLLSSMESNNYQAGHYTTQGDEKALFNRLSQELYNLRYLIVIDDVWDSNVWDRVRKVLPDKGNGSRILLTTRIPTVAKSIQTSGFIHEMQPLGPGDSWDKAFADDPCPPHLRDTGKSIAEKCNGLPLSITVVGGLLSQKREELEYWKRIEEDVSSAASEGQSSYEEILSLSYNHLPGKLKGCFLYMGAFPEDSEIRVSKLIKLWVAEGFLTLPKVSPPDQSLELVARRSLEDLIGRNLISIHKKSSNGGIKVCGMHDSLRELAEIESRKEKFFHSRKKYAQKLEEDMQIQRRVSVHRNILMCLEDVYSFTRSIKDARSLLYVGPHHHHPLPFSLTFDLLRVLDAFTVYFIDFPHEFLQLVHLRYLSFTYNDDLSPNISQLQNLQVLMVRREPKIIFVGVSFLPDEIWEMPQLRHLWFTETDFPALSPKISENRGALLHNLQTLTDINAASCTKEVLQRMPNLKKLGMWVEAPGVVGLYLDELEQLEAFKFTVLNPTPNKQVEFQPVVFFPPTLRKLSLSGCGLPWEDMEVIASLPSLEVLKLRELAFNGEEWCPSYVFENLKFLLIEYLNFKAWIADDSHFPNLEQLILRHCYKLEGIPSDIGYVSGLELIELVDCSPQAVESAEDIKQEQEGFDKKGFQVRIYSSYE